MTTQYNIYSYVKGMNGFGLRLSDTVYTATLTASTNTTVTVPKSAAQGTWNPTSGPNKFIAVVNTNGGKVWVANNTTASAPAGATFQASSSQLVLQNQANGIHVNGGDVLNFVTPDSNISVSVAFYAIQEG